MYKEQDKEQPNVDILNEVEKAIESLTFWKNEDCKNDNKQQLKQQVWKILQNYIKQGYTTIKAGCNEDTEIILQNPNTNKCKGIELGLAYFQYGECQNRTTFHICCGVKYDFEENKDIYYEDGELVEVTDEKRIKEIKKIADGTDNNENNIKYTYCELKDGKPVEVTDEKRIEKIQAIANGMDTDLDVGFCEKYFGWCCCCNSNAGLKALRDDSEYININHYQYKM